MLASCAAKKCIIHNHPTTPFSSVSGLMNFTITEWANCARNENQLIVVQFSSLYTASFSNPLSVPSTVEFVIQILNFPSENKGQKYPKQFPCTDPLLFLFICGPKKCIHSEHFFTIFQICRSKQNVTFQ